MDVRHVPFGVLLRRWREQRRVTQMDLALAAESSTRHLSCLETGKAEPSREMVGRRNRSLARDPRIVRDRADHRRCSAIPARSVRSVDIPKCRRSAPKGGKIRRGFRDPNRDRTIWCHRSPQRTIPRAPPAAPGSTPNGRVDPDLTNVVPKTPSATDFISARRSIFPSWQILSSSLATTRSLCTGNSSATP